MSLKFLLIIVLFFALLLIINYQLSKVWLLSSSETHTFNDDGRKTVYFITPTIRRLEQLADLTRLSHTLMLVPNLVWVVVEVDNDKSILVNELLTKSGLRFFYIPAIIPKEFKYTKMKHSHKVFAMNVGLAWIRENAKTGVVHFSEQGSTYDLEFFDDIKTTQKISMFPVGLVKQIGVSTPILQKNMLKGFYNNRINKMLPIDIFEFAISVEFLLNNQKIEIPYDRSFGQELIKNCDPSFDFNQIQWLASYCTKILVWRTQTWWKGEVSRIDLNIRYNNTNLVELSKYMEGFLKKNDTV